MLRLLAPCSLLLFLFVLVACSDAPAPAGPGGAGGMGGATTTTTRPWHPSTSSGQGGCGVGAQGGEGGEGGALYLDAQAGPQQTVEPGDVVTLLGSATAPYCGALLEFTWSQVAGEAVQLDDPHAATTSFTAPLNQGSLNFHLFVTDDQGDTATSSVIIIVGHAPPVAHAGPDQGALGGASITLAGYGSDPEGYVLGFKWKQVSGPTVGLFGAATATPSFALPATLTEPLVFALTVNNGFLDSPPDWVTVRRLTGKDSDGDLLEDELEITLGTDPEDPDTDHDGIPDGWEVLGHEDVDYAALGCDPRHRDLLVELVVQEYTKDGQLHSARPSPALLATLVDFYAALPLTSVDGLPGVALHFVDGPTLPEGFSCSWGGEFCELTDAPGDFLHREAFHKTSLCVGSSGGCADLSGRRFSVGFDAASGNDLAGAGAFAFHRVFIHEMGHNLGLHHGGGDAINHKPNYPSLMNYAYLESNSTLTFATGPVRLSHGLVPSIDECAVVEPGIFASLPPGDVAFLSSYELDMGWSVAADGSVDWDRDGQVSSTPYEKVLRAGGTECTLLEDNDDFARMDATIGTALPSRPGAPMLIKPGTGPRSVR